MSIIRRQRRQLLALALVATVAATLIGCSENGSSAAPDYSGPIKGQHITVVLPSYSKLPDDLLKKFERQTGVSVSLSLATWDDIHNRIATAGASGQAVGDVTEVDWSWIGQLAATGWYEPLDTALHQDVRDDLQNKAAFSRDGHLYAACYSNDARIGVYNTAMFERAGITSPPNTFAALGDDLAKIKASGISNYPIALTLSATQGAAAEWELFTVAMSGQLVNKSGKAAFRAPNSAGYRALQFEVSALRNGWAEPGSVSNNDQQTDALLSNGQAAVQLAGNPSELATLNNSGQSVVVNKTAYFLEPGTDGPGDTFGLPEGMGIPVASQHKAAAAAFINWMMRADSQQALFAATGQVPCGASAERTLVSSGALPGGTVIEDQLARNVPLFPNGAPAWFPTFTNEVAADVNAAAADNISVAEAIQRIADKIDQLASSER